MTQRPGTERYIVGYICSLELEQIAAVEMLDEQHDPLPQPPADHNAYRLGSIAGQNVAIARPLQPGKIPAAAVATQARATCPNLRLGLLVGIGGGGVPTVTNHGEIRLGEVVVGKPSGGHSGAV